MIGESARGFRHGARAQGRRGRAVRDGGPARAAGASGGPCPAPPSPEAQAVLTKLQKWVDEIARRSAAPTPGFAVAPERVLDERVMMRSDEPFGRWLLAQKDRADWVDELADAARADCGFPKNGSSDDVRKRLAEIGATGDTFEQVDDAERDWRSLAE